MFVIIVYHIKARRGLNFTRSAVLHPRLAPWNRLLNFDDELSILEMTGFSRQAFMLLESVCFPEESIIRRVGRPSSIDNRGKLGLYLFFVGSRMSVRYLWSSIYELDAKTGGAKVEEASCILSDTPLMILSVSGYH